MALTLYQNQPGQVEITKMALTSHSGKTDDISHLFHTIAISEEIDSFVATGEMLIPDTVGLLEFLPLIGGEKLAIRFRTNKNFPYYHKEFIVTKIKNESAIVKGKTSKMVRIFFASNKLLKNVEGQYSKSYNEELISEIVADIWGNQLGGGPIEIDPTLNFVNFVIPYWNPFTTIQYLMQKATSATYNDSAYVFYEDRVKFHFVPISHLFAKPANAKKPIILHKAYEEKGNKLHLAANYIGDAISFDFIHRTDIIEDIRKGVTGATIYTFDYTLKHMMKRGINWQKYYDVAAWNNGMHTIHPKQYLNKEAVVKEFNDHLTDKIVDGLDYPYIIFEMAKSFLRNQNRYNQLNSYVLVVNKVGDSSLTCGNMALVKYMSRDTSSVWHDKLYGNYLIKGVKHKLSRGYGYAQTLSLIKDAFWSDRHNVTYKIGGRINPGSSSKSHNIKEF